MGMDREFVKNSEPLYGVKFAVDSFATAAFKTSWLLGVAVSEGDDTAKAMARDLDIFRKHYQWVPDDALTFYKLHADVDVGAWPDPQRNSKKYADTKELQEACINAQLMKNNMRRVMADCIYMAYVVHGVKLNAARQQLTLLALSTTPRQSLSNQLIDAADFLLLEPSYP